MKRETPIMHEINEALLLTGRVLLFRNNGGVAKFGKHRVRYGLGVGGADLVGLLRPSGRGFALEVKTPIGDLEPEQIAWHRAWRSAGGFVECVTSVEAALAALAQAESGS